MLDKSSMAGTVLGALREARGVIQSVIADECGRSVSYISQWENGHENINIGVVAIYAEKLNIEEKDIFNLINLWNAKQQQYYSSRSDFLEYPSFKDRAFNAIRREYYQTPLHPRTRTDRKPRF